MMPADPTNATTLAALLATIDATVRPKGGAPQLTAGQLNGLLRTLTTALAPAEVSPSPPARPRPVQVLTAFGPGQPITFAQATDYEDAEGLPLTEGFDNQHSLGAFSYDQAVRGTTVRVQYFASEAFSLPPGFNLLSGPLPTDNARYVIYLRYVRPGVVDVTVGPGEAGTYLGRFWASPGVTDLGLGLYMGRDTRVLARTSEGGQVRSGAFNGGGPAVHFASAEGPRYFDVLAYAGSPTLPALACGSVAGIGPVYGELNLDTLPALTGFCNLQFSRGYTRIVAHKPGLDLLVAYRYEGTLLDLGACVVNSLNASSSYCTSLVLPPPNDVLTALNLAEHRLFGQELCFPSLPRLATLDLTTGQHGVGRLDVVDISKLPALATLSTSQASLRTLVIGDNALAALTSLDLSMGRLTGRPEPFGQGSLGVVCQVLARAPHLAYLHLGYNGLTEAELAQVVEAARTAATTAEGRQLILADNADGSPSYYLLPGYPGPYNNDPYFGYTYNAPVVSAATRAAIGQLRAAGWLVRYNEAVPLRATIDEAGHLHATYYGPAPVDVWAVGDTLDLTSVDPGRLPSGPYTVVAGSGQAWELAPAAPDAPTLLPYSYAVWVAATPPGPGVGVS
ncbi:hypothetical protein GCM10027422_43430 [Hymenobacter arcticus]